MYCKECGKQVPEDAKLCPYCGVDSNPTTTTTKAPKSKKKGCLTGCLGIIVLLVVLGIIGAIFGGNSTTSTTGQKKIEKHALKIGEAFKSDAFEMTITGKDVTKRVTDKSGYLYSDANGVFVVVHVHYKNIADNAKRLDNSAFKLVADGKTYSPVTLTIRLQDNIFLDQINPGIEKDGDVYFDVPEAVAKSNLTLKLSSSFLSDNFNGEVQLY